MSGQPPWHPLPPPKESAGESKAYAAERRIAIVRTAVIVFNVGAYYLLLPPGTGIPWLAITISIVALVYSTFVILTRPYRWWPVMRAALFTALTDGVLIVLWVAATGGFASPFYLLWLLSMMAVVFRYEARATWIATGLYIGSYLALLAWNGELAVHAVDVTIRCTYIGLAGMLGALLASDSAQVFREQAKTQRDIEALQRKQEIKELERLRELDRFKTEFINSAAHELNTPLTPLRLQLHLLQSTAGTDEKARERAVRVLKRNVDRMVSLVEDMLDIARLQSNRLRLEPAPTDVADLVRDALETYEAQAAQKDIVLRRRGPDTLPVVLDAKRVSQILYNLVSNAIKYSPSSKAVEVQYGIEAGLVVVRVVDQGYGFTAQQKELMFVPFGQAHRDQVTASGTGLGLFISRGIAHRHGGTLQGTSEGTDRGATFTLTLPIAPVDASDQPQSSSADPQ